MTQRPLLAAPVVSEAELEKLRYPLFVSPKLDGIRLRIDPQLGAVSRQHKPIRNRFIQQVVAEEPRLSYLDGEVISGDPTAPDVFNQTQSDVMSSDGSPHFFYHVFDHWFNPTTGYDLRYEHVKEVVRSLEASWQGNPSRKIFLVPQQVVTNPTDVLVCEAEALTAGYEGIILRSPTAPYKNGRSTFREQILLKFKRVQDAEAVIVGFLPLERNQNPKELDVYGLARRSSHKDGKIADDLLGTLLVEHVTFGQFGIGSGFDVSTREAIWHNQSDYLGKTVTFKYQPAGMKDKPRFPIFKGIRHD